MSKGKQHEAEASEGARRATAEASASWALVGTGRWSARRKVSVVIEVLKGESLESLSRRHGVTAAKLSQWRDDFVAGGEARLKHREVAVEGADTRRLKSVVADLATDKALLAEKIRHLEAGRPLGWWRFEAMSHETSPSTHRPYGIARVTRVWQVPRSTVYAQRNRRARPTPVAKRGPKPPQSDAELTAAVRAVIAASPFHGEGHRKIWARLRVQGLRTSKRRDVGRDARCRLARPCAAAHAGRRPSPRRHHRHRQSQRDVGHRCDGHRDAGGRPRHDLRAIDHCTAECVGLHAAKYGTRFRWSRCARASEITSGTMAAGVASGLTMRHDHGSQYMSNDFHAELRFLGIVSSPAFVRQPEGNGCIERFFRTLKEQLLWVRHFTDVEDLQQALRTFKETYNQQWLIERLGFRAPAVVRRAFALTTAA